MSLGQTRVLVYENKNNNNKVAHVIFQTSTFFTRHADRRALSAQLPVRDFLWGYEMRHIPVYMKECNSAPATYQDTTVKSIEVLAQSGSWVWLLSLS